MAISKLNPIEGGIPKGNTSNRSTEFPSPATGDVYYNGELEILEIYNGTGWVAVSAPPATPSIATPTDASTADAYTSTAGKLSVVFTPGSGGGTPNQYNAYTTSGGYSGFNATSTVVISGLTPGTAYTVYGNAQNNFGTTVNTANAAAVTPTTLPQTPTIGTATASSSANEVTVTWTNGATGGKNLSAITITPFLNGTTAETSRTAATTSSTSYTFTEGQLTAGAAYTFKVKATNANGTSADSTATNSVTVANFITVDFLVLAGGGGGAGYGGGGGAGGLRSSVGKTGRNATLESPISVSAGVTCTITVGSGSAATSYNATRGPAGGNSSISVSGFTTVTSLGGGASGSNGSTPGGSGGCGGGGNGGHSSAGGSGTTGQGFDGGTASGNSAYTGGGGGGTGGAGAASTGTAIGNGGVGLQITDWATPTSTGANSGYYGGGGGGSSDQGRAGAGGLGGGGAGSNAGSNASPGTANTGGGGGSAIQNNGTSAAGGSGLVLLRFSGTYTAAATTGSPTRNVTGGYTYYTFTGDGSITI
jgi:hypothetical protein